jgi:hypothetical protein
MKNETKAARPVLFFVCIWAAGLITLPAAAQQHIPDALLRVTVQQRETGKLTPEFHVQELFCSSGNCSLITVTLNSCRPSPASNGKASPVTIERSSTIDGNLRVTNEGNTLVVVEAGVDIGGDSNITQRFTYEKPRDGGIIKRVTQYTGGFVKNSVLAKRVITVDYVPLASPSGFKEVIFNCPVGVPAVQTSN